MHPLRATGGARSGRESPRQARQGRRGVSPLGMRPIEARSLFATARVARLATADAGGRPHLVPICFAIEGDLILTAVDHKPKRATRLRRLENVAANPRVSALADRYDDDWSR